MTDTPKDGGPAFPRQLLLRCVSERHQTGADDSV